MNKAAKIRKLAKPLTEKLKYQYFGNDSILIKIQ